MKSNFWKDLELSDKVGQGSFGTVYKAVSKDGSVYAIKHVSLPREPLEIEILIKNGVIKEPQEANDYFANIMRREIEIMQRFNGNPYIIDYYDVHQYNKPDGSRIDFYIKMEYAEDITKYFENKTVNVNDVVKLGIDICSALELCYSIGLIHDDIKPNNIFLGSDGKYKLGDFSIANNIDNQERNNFGALSYISPEVYQKRGANPATDLYSLGLVMYKLINGEIPFKTSDNDEKKAFTMRMSGQQIPTISGLDEKLMLILNKACSFNSQDRYQNISEMKKDLEALPHIVFDDKIISFLNEKTESTLGIYEVSLSNEQNNKNIQKDMGVLTKVKKFIFNKEKLKKIIGIIILILIIIILFRSCSLNKTCDVGYINKNGSCVKGYYYCESGYTLNADNKCQKTLESIDAKVTYTCKSGYTLNGEVCVSNDVKEPQFTYKCADGFTVNGTKCEKEESADAVVTYSCPSGYVIAGDQCVTVSNVAAIASGYTCEDSSYTLSGTTCKKTVTQTTQATISYSCEAGGTLNGTECNYTSSPTYSGWMPNCYNVGGNYNPMDRMCHYSKDAIVTYNCSQGTSDGRGNCIYTKTETKQAISNYTCPNGYTAVGNQCAKTTGTAATAKYICADGTELRGKKCYTTVSTDAVGMYACEDGYVASGTLCYKNDFPSAIKKYTCSRVYTLNGEKCEKYEIVEAKAHYNE